MQKGISSASQVTDSHSWRRYKALEREPIISENLTPPPSAIEQPVALRALPRNVWAVTVTSFLTDISSEMIVNLLPLFLANVLGVHTALIGLIEGIAETTASLLKAFSGWVSDRLGRRKWLAVSGYAVSTVAKPFLYPAASWLAVLAVRFADRLGKGIRTAPRDALVADSIDDGRRGLAFGLHRAGDTAGAFLGLVIALVVVWRAQAGALLLARPTFQRLVLLSIVPAALAVLVLALASREVSRPGRQVAKPRLSLAGLDSRFRRFLAVIVLFALGNSADAFLILRAQERGLGILGVLGMLATFNLVYAAVSGPAGALSDRVGRRALIIGGWLAYGLLYLGFALAGHPWQVWLLYALYGIYYGAVEGTTRAYVADIVEPHERGTAYGLYNSAVGLAALPASLIAGVLWQGAAGWAGFGPAAPFLFGAALALLAVGLFVIWATPRPTRPRGTSGRP
jgi:MFS family permease